MGRGASRPRPFASPRRTRGEWSTASLRCCRAPPPVLRDLSVVEALLLDAIARDRLGERQAAESDIERALDLAEPEALIFPFVVVPVRELLERHPRHRTAHAGLLSVILDVLAGSRRPRARGEPASSGGPERKRAARPPLPAKQPVCAGDRLRALPFDQHRQDAHASHLREARRSPPHRGGGAGPSARTARTALRTPPLATTFTLSGRCPLILSGAMLVAMDDRQNPCVTRSASAGSSARPCSAASLVWTPQAGMARRCSAGPCPIRRPSTACSTRSRRSASSCSKCAASLPRREPINRIV